jgi:eukaryotic-like serine/threonine-protein kinase
MKTERRKEVEALFDAALDRPRSERTVWLDGACAGDAALRAEVAGLLAAHDRATGILDLSPRRMAALLGPDYDTIDVVPRVGPYRLVREVGRGGMGSVYLAERDDDHYRQQVAVKILRRGLDTDELVRRFVAERQILATLQHPNIARLLDGGMTSDGRPYYVMEFVDGEHLDAYCDSRRLSIEARLELFCVVVRAVQHAHRNLVVHRDLKPSNVLVTADGEVKLVDFGIAKLLDPDAFPDAAPLTRTGLRLMTPEYASPEQVRGMAITTATDVYGLGLVLYELLAGRHPHRLRGRSATEIERIILTEEPPRPSAALTQVDEVQSDGVPVRVTPEQIAAARGLPVERLCRRLRGDLDRIVLCALRKEPDRRYQSAAQLADDIERYLRGKPVAARGDSVAYRARKFAGRHVWGVAAGASIVVLLAGYAATVTMQAREVRAALDQARLEAEKAEQVTAFTMGLFETGDPAAMKSDSMTVRDLLQHGVDRAERLGSQPATQAQLFDVIGRVYQNLGEYARAQLFLERALALRRRTLGARHPATAESLDHVAGLLLVRGQYAAAESLYREALALQRAALGEPHATIARTLAGLGSLLQERGHYAGAERLAREALAMRRELYGGQHPEVAQSLSSLAVTLQLQGRYAEAEALFRDALAMRRRLFGDEHPEVATAMSNLGLLLIQRGELAPADSLYRASLALRRRMLGNDHPDVAASVGLLGVLLRREGDIVGAESTYHAAIALIRRSLGPDHPNLAHSLNGLALVLRDKGDLRGADSLYREVLAIRRRALGDEHPAIATSLYQLGVLRQEEGDVSAAESLLVQSLQMRRKLLGDSHPHVAESARQLVLLYERSGRREEAAPFRTLLRGH